MHYSFHRRSMLALAALPLASAAANATSLGTDSGTPQHPVSDADLPSRHAKPATTLSSDLMVGKKLRVFEEGDAVTMDYSEDRVNIEVDARRIIKRVFIG